jgi:hypothetical protein
VGQDRVGVNFESKLAMVILFRSASFSHRGWPKDNLMQYVTFGGCCKGGKCVISKHLSDLVMITGICWLSNPESG